MKQGTIIVRIMMLVLFLGVAAYFGVYLWNAMGTDTATATLYTYTAEERVDSHGYFFRDEVVLTEASAMAEGLASEGEKVGSGDPVARVYSSQDGYAIQEELDEAESTLESLNYILSRTGNLGASAGLDGEIVESFTSLRAQVAAGNLGGLSQSTGELKSLIFRRDYSFSGTDSLTAEIEATQARVDALKDQAASQCSNVLAPAAGLYSSSVDGYESVLTVDALEGLTPGRLEELSAQNTGVTEANIGKIITNNGWYFACNVAEGQTDKLYRNARVQLRFESSPRVFDANVYSVSSPEEGKVAIVFYSEAYPALVTTMRGEQVEIITGGATGLRVPKRAVRVLEDGSLGVYRVSGAQANWVAVEILWESEDFYLVRQAPTLDEEGNEVRMSDYDKATALRDGDTVIIKGEQFYDGKVVS